VGSLLKWAKYQRQIDEDKLDFLLLAAKIEVIREHLFRIVKRFQ
jgi:hypothetical protein